MPTKILQALCAATLILGAPLWAIDDSFIAARVMAASNLPAVYFLLLPHHGNPPYIDEHANLTFSEYPANCLGCHAEEANETLNATHYRWLGNAPDMVNGVGEQQGKLNNAVNSYCVHILGNWPVCGSCHAGRGLRPDDPSAEQSNVDCLVCHSVEYATARTRLIDGSMGVINPTDTMVRGVGRPTRANCLKCHALAGGGDGVKRGDLSRTLVNNSDAQFDVHMNTSGPNLQCQRCHAFQRHRVIGKGSDIRPTDDPHRGAEVACTTCHAEMAESGHDRSPINSHIARVACQSCHIPTYAKVATEIHRNWLTHHDGTDATTCTAEAPCPGHPYTEKSSTLIPQYRWWNRKSDNMLLYDDASRSYNSVRGTYPTSRPMGDVTDGKLHPFKYKTARQPMMVANHRLIAIDTSVYLTGNGNVDEAVGSGLENMGYNANEPYEWVTTETFQLINHGVEPSGNALDCNACHDNTSRMDLQGALGYELNANEVTVCSQCHNYEEAERPGYRWIHEEHVSEEGYDCSWCHTFSRPERDLRMR